MNDSNQREGERREEGERGEQVTAPTLSPDTSTGQGRQVSLYCSVSPVPSATLKKISLLTTETLAACAKQFGFVCRYVDLLVYTYICTYSANGECCNLIRCLQSKTVESAQP